MTPIQIENQLLMNAIIRDAIERQRESEAKKGDLNPRQGLFNNYYAIKIYRGYHL